MLKLKIPPPIYMLLTAGLMWLADKFIPLININFPLQHVLALCLIATALASDGLSILHFLRRKTSMNPIHPENASHLVTSGLYRYSRNPMYVGLGLILTGWALLLGSFSPFLCLPLFILVMTRYQIIPEEIILEQLFKQPYRDYKQTVKRWL